MIHCIVRSNDDNLRSKQWPTNVACKPDIGDYMQCLGGFIGKVCRVTHLEKDSDESGLTRTPGPRRPMLLIELTK